MGNDGLLGGNLRHKKKPPFQGAFAATAPARLITLHDQARWAWGGLDTRPGKDMVTSFFRFVKGFSSCFAGAAPYLTAPASAHRPNRLRNFGSPQYPAQSHSRKCISTILS